MKILFITHEGIDTSIFNSQVLTHALSMKKLSVNVDILSFNTNKKTRLLSAINHQKILESNVDINIILKFGFNMYAPFSSLLNGFLLILFFLKNKNKYSIIHCRSDYTTFIGVITKFIHKSNIIWDCRGDSLDELSDSLGRKNNLIKFLGKFFLKPVNQLQILISAKFSDAAIFVSEALYNIHSEILKTKLFKIIPCPVSEELFFFRSDIRNMFRLVNNISDNDIVFLYSGSLAAYQSLDLQEEFYARILNDSRNIILFATVDEKLAKEYFKDKFNERFIIKNIPFTEMNNYYNMSDFAILLRSNKQLNRVSSPTKFGEYCLTGLPVIMNDTIEQSLEFSKKLGNHIGWTELDFEKFNDNYRNEISINAKKYFARNESNKLYNEIYYSLNN